MNSKRLKALELLQEGRAIKDICEELGISRRTLERWRLKPEFTEVSAEYREHCRDFRERMANLTPKVLDEVEAIALSNDVRTADKLRALTVLGGWAGLAEKPEPEPRRIEIPGRDFTDDEVRNSLVTFQDNLKLLAIGQIVEGAEATNLSEMTEAIDNLNAIMTEINRFSNLTFSEIVFDQNIKTYTHPGNFNKNVLPFKKMQEGIDLEDWCDSMEENFNKSDEERGVTPEMRRKAEAYADEMMRRQEQEYGDTWVDEVAED